MKSFSKIISLLFFLFIACNQVNVFAQTPYMEYSTFIGGNNSDYGHAITVDDQGYAYVAGQTSSSNYPTTAGAFDRSANGGADILVSKLNREGTALVYSTYIGGPGFDDTRKIFVDNSGCVFLTGSTESSNFPVTANSLQGNSQGYFLKLDSAGNHLAYSSRWAGGEKILLDHQGYAIILGSTSSGSFPTTENAYSRTLAGGTDLFVAKIDINNNQIIFSTLIGGSGDEWAPSMTIDSNNDILIAGQTTSENYPVKGNTFASYTSGKSNAFVTKLKSDGTQLIWSTIIGGSDNDLSFDVTVDLDDNVYITGVTSSIDFPISASAFDTSYSGGQDAFLSKLSSDGSRIIYSTYLGGTEKESGRGVVVDKYGKAYLTGCTRSANFPTTQNAFDKTYNGAGTDQWAWGDPYLVVMNSDGTQIEYSTYFGGSNDEEAYGIAMDKFGDIYLSGVTSSSNFPTTQNAYDRSLNGGGNIYVTKFSFSSPTGSLFDYLGEPKPGNSAIAFANNIISRGDVHGWLVISPDGKEVLWNTILSETTVRIMHVIKVDDTWSEIELPSFAAHGFTANPLFSPDGRKLFFEFKESENSSWFTKYIEKTDTAWSDPKSDGFLLRCSSSFTKSGKVYFTNYMEGKIWNVGIYCAQYSDTGLSDIKPLPGNINSPDMIEYTPYIAPDESYLMFSSNRPVKGENDVNMNLYISFNNNGTWSDPQKMNDAIGFQGKARYPSISPDGKYLFFCGDDRNIYWVDIKAIDHLKPTGVEKEKPLLKNFYLNQNYPNPFNPCTTISYQLSDNSNVKLKIYDTLGQEIKTLVDSFQNEGEQSIVWNATDNFNNLVNSGIYFYSLQADDLHLQKKMILVR